MNADSYQVYLDPVIEMFTTGEYYREVFKAKNEYFEKTGTIYDDDDEFEQRMCLFMDWYLFERDLPGVDLPPIKFFYRKNKNRFTTEELAIYKDLCNTVHSIFRLRRFTWGKKLLIKDLFSNKTFKITEADMTQGFSKGDIFEARVIPFQKGFLFSKGFCFHPIEMESFILNEIKKVRYQDQNRQTKLILQLSQMKLKHLRFRHIDVKHIYTFDSRF